MYVDKNESMYVSYTITYKQLKHSKKIITWNKLYTNCHTSDGHRSNSKSNFHIWVQYTISSWIQASGIIITQALQALEIVMK
jgi:hypothetical protein